MNNQQTDERDAFDKALFDYAMAFSESTDGKAIKEARERVVAMFEARTSDAQEAFEWPPLPGFPKAFLDSEKSGAVFTEHQMQSYANAYGESVRAAASAQAMVRAVLSEERIAQIAHYCEAEAHACPGTNMWMCAHMAVEETLRALAEPCMHLQIAEVCQDADGFKHIEAVIEDLDDIPAGTRLYLTPKATIPSLTDEQIIERCKSAGIKWIPPELPDECDYEMVFPGLFDMVSMDEMRVLLGATK